MFDGTLDALAAAYRTDADSPYHKKRYVTRQFYDKLLEQLTKKHGSELVANIKGRTVLRWHEEWSAGGKVAMAHALVGMLRTIVNFGVTMLESDDCERLSGDALCDGEAAQRGPDRRHGGGYPREGA